MSQDLVQALLGPIDLLTFLKVVTRIFAALILGGIIGYNRERAKKPAGLRSHIMICLGTAIFVMAGSIPGMSDEAISRIMQGIGPIIGGIFLITIIKSDRERFVEGVTTATTFIPTAGIGILTGIGYVWVAIIGTLATWVVLHVLVKFEMPSTASNN